MGKWSKNTCSKWSKGLDCHQKCHYIKINTKLLRLVRSFVHPFSQPREALSRLKEKAQKHKNKFGLSLFYHISITLECHRDKIDEDVKSSFSYEQKRKSRIRSASNNMHTFNAYPYIQWCGKTEHLCDGA